MCNIIQIFHCSGQDEAMEDMDKKKELIRLVQQIVPSQMKHHAEAEACDLLMEVSIPFLRLAHTHPKTEPIVILEIYHVLNITNYLTYF